MVGGAAPYIKKSLGIGAFGESWVVGSLLLGAIQHANASIALALIMWYLASFEISLGPVFWVMIAEIYALRSRAKAMALATMVNWTFNFLVSYFFLQMTDVMGKAGTFWLYAGFGVAAIVFFAFKLPETKGRSLEEIESQVRGETGGQDAAAA